MPKAPQSLARLVEAAPAFEYLTDRLDEAIAWAI